MEHGAIFSSVRRVRSSGCLSPSSLDDRSVSSLGMRPIVPALIIGMTILLAACGASTSQVQATVTTDTDPARSIYLFNAVERMLESRMTVAGYQEPMVTVSPVGSINATVSIPVIDDAMRSTVEGLLSNDFSLDFRIEDEEVPLGEDARWKATDLTSDALDWVVPIGDRSTGNIGIELQFTPSGRATLEHVFRNNAGRQLGIFVRGLLMSKLTIPDAMPEERIVIRGVPSEEAAEIFSADVNVGLHVTFAPLP